MLARLLRQSTVPTAVLLLSCATTLSHALPAGASVPLHVLDLVSVPEPLAQAVAGQPLQFAVPIDVELGSAGAGQWSTRADRRVWQLQINSLSATSLSLALEVQSIPDGAEIRVRDAAYNYQFGPYTSADLVDGELWTPTVPGDTVEIEFSVPAETADGAALRIVQVNHGYLEFWKDGARAKSGGCNVDVACGAGDEWRNEIRSVARYTVSGMYLCSGTLLNNTLGNFAPYFLTANHCVQTPAEAASMVFYWNFETSRCGGSPDGRLDQTQSGAIMLTTAPLELGDHSLVQLNARPRAEFDVYYAGWDARDLAPPAAVTIHHPAGDEKRISFEHHPLTVTSLYEDRDFGDSAYLRVADWDLGTTEGGSSGSGLWNPEHRLVGTLTGGSAACGNNAPDWYGRMHAHWSAGAGTFLAPPLGLTLTLDGADPNDGPLPATPTSAPTSSSASIVPASAKPAPANVAGRAGAGWPLFLLIVLGLRVRRRIEGPLY